MTHYHDERNHQGLENRLLRPLWAVGELDARVKRRQRLGGMLSYYHREAA
jgi:putative transposase